MAVPITAVVVLSVKMSAHAQCALSVVSGNGASPAPILINHSNNFSAPLARISVAKRRRITIAVTIALRCDGSFVRLGHSKNSSCGSSKKSSWIWNHSYYDGLGQGMTVLHIW